MKSRMIEKNIQGEKEGRRGKKKKKAEDKGKPETKRIMSK